MWYQADFLTAGSAKMCQKTGLKNFEAKTNMSELAGP